jgi:HlyD family secretion protein
MRTKLCWFILPLAALATGCANKQETEAESVVPVQTAEVRRAPIRRVIHADGVLYPIDQAAVMPKISAPVRAFHVNRGDRVDKGQLLAELENADLTAAALETKGEYEQALSALRSTTAASVPDELIKAQLDVKATKQALEAAQTVYTSRQELFKQGALARRQVDEAQVAFVQAQTQYDAARQHLTSLEKVNKEEMIKAATAQVQIAKGRVDAAAAQLSYAEIRSPISGVIADRPLYPGEMATAGTPLLTVMDISRVVARANVPATEAAHLKVGDPATLSQGEGAAEVPGKVTVVSPAADPNTTTIQVWVEAANPGAHLKPGMAVRVSILADTIPGATVIPESALLPGAGGTSEVIVIGNDMIAHERAVQAGVRDDSSVEILSGVKPGERVVTVGGLGLREGGKVRFATPDGKETGKDRN